MISEIVFAREYTSFWRMAAPMLERFVRRVNRGMYVRDFVPMRAETAPDRRGFLNQVAFVVFCSAVEAKQKGANVSSSTVINEALAFVQANERAERGEDYDSPLNRAEVSDIEQQVARLKTRLVPFDNWAEVVCRPIFRGCGIVDVCEGDLAVGGELFEIKAGERYFRSIDFRQVLIYLALDRAGGSSRYDRVALVNPRIGVSFAIEVEEMCFEVSGTASGALLGYIVDTVASGDVSR